MAIRCTAKLHKENTKMLEVLYAITAVSVVLLKYNPLD